MADTLSPVATITLPVGSLTLGPFTTLDLPVGSITLGPLTEVTIWGESPRLLRADQARAPLLGVLRSADMNSTADQPIVLGPKNYIIRRVIITGASEVLNVATGGIYTGPGKTGTALVPAAQTYSALTSPSKFIDTGQHLSTTTDTIVSGLLYFSLTSPQGGPANADIYIYGDSVES